LLHRTLCIGTHADQPLDMLRQIADDTNSVLNPLRRGGRLSGYSDGQRCPHDHQKAFDEVFHLRALAPRRARTVAIFECSAYRKSRHDLPQLSSALEQSLMLPIITACGINPAVIIKVLSAH
jgi:hypothetical protein